MMKLLEILFMFLLICRYLFDCYVIKSNAIRTGEENWSLWAVMPNDSSYYYKNTFGNNTESKNNEELDDSDDTKTKTVVMLLSMFHVSNPSRIYKTGCMRYYVGYLIIRII